MNTTTRISDAERLGRAFGRGWRAYARGERRMSNWLVSEGVPVAGTTVLRWVIKLTALGVLLYTTFWLALLLVGLMLVARSFGKGGEDFSPPCDELRPGEAGFGLYSSGGYRLDPHDYNNSYDD